MRALDTNVLARFFIDDADDTQVARQRPAAIAALAERCFVSVTVLLELEWVMRGFYELPPKDVSRVLRALASIEHVTLEDRAAVLVAIDVLDKGLDFADALHLARSSRAAGFATFDQRLAKRAKRLALAPPVELLANFAGPPQTVGPS
jgi:predicted nucleic-acid-binding protein